LPENPTRATNQLSAPLLVTLREVVPFEVVKVAVSDVEENSVMTRVLIAFARIGCVTSAAAIVIAKSARREPTVLVFIALALFSAAEFEQLTPLLSIKLPYRIGGNTLRLVLLPFGYGFYNAGHPHPLC
jgi:hypothetical protein